MALNSVDVAYFQANIRTWWRGQAVNPPLYHALDQQYQAFKVMITHQQVAVGNEKDKSRSWKLASLIPDCIVSRK